MHYTITDRSELRVVEREVVLADVGGRADRDVTEENPSFM